MAFSTFKLHPDLLRGAKELGFLLPTSIQIDAIPPAMAGRDVLEIPIGERMAKIRAERAKAREEERGKREEGRQRSLAGAGANGSGSARRRRSRPRKRSRPR